MVWMVCSPYDGSRAPSLPTQDFSLQAWILCLRITFITLWRILQSINTHQPDSSPPENQCGSIWVCETSVKAAGAYWQVTRHFFGITMRQSRFFRAPDKIRVSSSTLHPRSGQTSTQYPSPHVMVWEHIFYRSFTRVERY